MNKLIPIIAIIGAFLAIFTDLFQKGVEMTEKGIGIDLVLSMEGKIIWLGFVISLTLFIFTLFLKNYFKSNPTKKLKIQYFLVGISIWITTNLIFNVYFPIAKNTFQYAYLGNYSILLLFAFTAYAIVKQELFGIKVVITAIFISLIAILLALDALMFTDNFVIQLFKGGVLIIFLYFGYMLIKSVIGEIERRKEIEKLSKAKSEFISIASHQLRTPLTAVKGYISMILEGTYGEIPPKAIRPMENVYQSNERLVKLVNDMLNLSRIEAGKLKVEWQKASIEEMISSIVDIFKIEAEKKGLYLTFEKPDKPLAQISMDQSKMREVVSNIVNNAIKYTEKGGITIRVKKLISSVQIIVSDTGAGMTEDEMAKVFQSFSRGTVGTKMYTQGAGLGLYVARRFVEMHGGKIWPESEGRGKGSNFIIELPIKNNHK